MLSELCGGAVIVFIADNYAIGYSSFRSVPVRVRRELLLQGLAGLEQVRGDMAQNVFP